MNVEHLVVALIASFTGAGVGAWTLKFLQQYYDKSRREGGDAFVRQGQMIDRIEKQLTIMQITATRAMVSERTCREKLAAMRSEGRWLYDMLKLIHSAAVKAGVPVGDLPKIPERFIDTALESVDQEFVRRQAEHTIQLMRDKGDPSS